MGKVCQYMLTNIPKPSFRSSCHACCCEKKPIRLEYVKIIDIINNRTLVCPIWVWIYPTRLPDLTI